MNERPPCVLLLGNLEAEDFLSIRHAVRSWRPTPDSRTAADMKELRRLAVGQEWHPDVIVVLQSWPDQFSEADVHDILALCPLARIVCAFGPWCDSDGRTRSIWPLAVRVPVAVAARRVERELDLLSGRNVVRQPLPLTASRADIFEFDFGSYEIEARIAQTVIVISPERRWKEMIESGLRNFGIKIHDQRRAEPPEIVIFDADPWNAERAVSLRAIRAADREARIIVAIGFPRPDFAAALHESGADQIWFKLAPLGDLFAFPWSGDRRVAGSGTAAMGRGPTGSPGERL